MSFAKLIVYIPELIGIAKTIWRQIKNGKTQIEIRRGLKAIEEAFSEEDLVKKAAALSKEFNDKL